MEERKAIRKAMRSNPKAAQQLAEMAATGKLRSEADQDPEEELAMICMRGAGVVDDSSQEPCGMCGEMVALAPSSQEVLKRRGRRKVKILCVECYMAGAAGKPN